MRALRAPKIDELMRDTMKYFRPLLFLSAILLVGSCNSYNKVLKSANYDLKYEMAKQYYAQGLYNRATLLFNEVLAPMRGTENGEESLFLLGMSAYKAHDFDAASSYLKKYCEAYPKGIYVEEAAYVQALSYYEQAPEPKLDQTKTYEAVTLLQSFVENYPTSQYRDDVHKKIFELQDLLVEKEYLTAKLYYDLGPYYINCSLGGNNYEACIITAENAILDYPYTSLREQFAILILKAKFELARQSVEEKKEERYQNAVEEYYGFTNEYPESSFLPQAKKLFNSAQKFLGRTTNTEDDTKA